MGTVFLVRFGQVAWDEWFVACGHPTIKDSLQWVYIYMRMYVYIDLYEWIEDPRMNGLKTPNMD